MKIETRSRDIIDWNVQYSTEQLSTYWKSLELYFYIINENISPKIVIQKNLIRPQNCPVGWLDHEKGIKRKFENVTRPHQIFTSPPPSVSPVSLSCNLMHLNLE